MIQLVGILAVGGFTALMSALIWQTLKFTIGIRVNEEEERSGLDIGEHGMEAYTGFAKEQDMMNGSGENEVK
jgi:Amt family ammonium transporter